MAKTKLRKPLQRSGVDPEQEKPELRVVEPPKGVRGENAAKLIFLERKIRMFVKRTGGTRKGLHKEDVKDAKDLVKADPGWSKRSANRESRPRTVEDGWDMEIVVKGYDNCDHEENQRGVKPRTVG